MRDTKERLRDILDAMARIGRYTSRGRDAFDREELIQVWVVRHLQMIGEAASQLGRDFHATHSEVPWPEIIAMRNATEAISPFQGLLPKGGWALGPRPSAWALLGRPYGACFRSSNARTSGVHQKCGTRSAQGRGNLEFAHLC